MLIIEGMKVDGPNKTSGAKGVSKSGARKGSGDSSFSGMIGDTDEADAPSGASGLMATAPLDALLSLQELGNSTEEGSKRAKQHASSLLDQLDRIRVGMLTGSIPPSALQQLTRLIAQQREQVTDPKLAEILDDIDLRAQVELAKFQQNA